jgi:hypothetical protein
VEALRLPSKGIVGDAPIREHPIHVEENETDGHGTLAEVGIFHGWWLLFRDAV